MSGGAAYQICIDRHAELTRDNSVRLVPVQFVKSHFLNYSVVARRAHVAVFQEGRVNPEVTEWLESSKYINPKNFKFDIAGNSNPKRNRYKVLKFSSARH